MIESEKKAKAFLEKMGIKEITHAQDIDFVTEQGKFEVKVANGRTIVVTPTQRKLIDGKADFMFLVFPNKNSKEPIMLSVTELQQNYNLTDSREAKNVKVSDLNHAKLRALLLELVSKRGNLALVMDDAVSELFERAEAKVKP